VYFNNTEIKPTVNYYVQQLYGLNAGDTYLATEVKLSDSKEAVRKRIAVSVVHDSKANDLIVKLVNMLPVAVNTQVALKSAGDIQTQATKTILTGTPGDKKSKPVTETISVDNSFPCALPAYSFVTIRLKTK
jgi:alpha-L-arabinofuranosidase